MILFNLFGCSALWIVVHSQIPEYNTQGTPQYGPQSSSPYDQGSFYKPQDPLHTQQGIYNQGANYPNQNPQNNLPYPQNNPLYPQNNPQYPQQGSPYNTPQGQDGLYNPQGNYNQQGSFYNQGNYNQGYNPQGGTYYGGIISNDVLFDYRCPEYWLRYERSCYRFIKSPLKSYHDARRICQV